MMPPKKPAPTSTALRNSSAGTAVKGTELMASGLRAFGIIVNDLCPLNCRHCSLGYTDGYRGTRWQIEESELRLAIRAAAEGPYSVVLMAGGEPSLAPHLVQSGAEACRQHGIASAVVTAPVWAATPETARRFLAKVPALDVVMLSYDAYHLEFITPQHYLNAAREATARGSQAFLNICHSNERQKTELTDQVECLRDYIGHIHFQAVLPLGNARELGIDSTQIDEEQDLLRLRRTCEVGNALLHRDGSVYACCWASRAETSPLRFLRGEDGLRSSLREMETDPIFTSFKKHGPIDSLSPQGRSAAVRLVRGQRFVNECDFCMRLMHQPEKWSTLFVGNRGRRQ